MFALMGAWCSAANVAKIEDCRIEGWRGATVGDGGWWDAIGPLPAVALAWRGPLRVVDTTFSSANSSTPAIASFTAQQSLAVSGWPDNIENGTWAKTYLLVYNIYVIFACMYRCVHMTHVLHGAGISPAGTLTMLRSWA